MLESVTLVDGAMSIGRGVDVAGTDSEGEAKSRLGGTGVESACTDSPSLPPSLDSATVLVLVALAGEMAISLNAADTSDDASPDMNSLRELTAVPTVVEAGAG